MRFTPVLFALCAACHRPEPPNTSIPTASEIVTSDTPPQADSLLEPTAATLQPLENLPPLTLVRDPGSELQPAVMIELASPKTGAELAAAYARMYEAIGWMKGWMPYAQTDAGWVDFVIARDVGLVRRVACALDIIQSTRKYDDGAEGLPQLRRGCAMLSEALGGRLGPLLDESDVIAKAERAARARSEHGTIELTFEAPNGMLRRRALATLRALGFEDAWEQRFEDSNDAVGKYEWYREADPERDFELVGVWNLPLLVVDFGTDPEEERGADTRTSSVDLDLVLSDAPAPEIVAARAWQVAIELERALGVAPVWRTGEARTPVTRELFDARVQRSIAALREAGFWRDVVVHDVSDQLGPRGTR